jgi:hypothetical protein
LKSFPLSGQPLKNDLLAARLFLLFLHFLFGLSDLLGLFLDVTGLKFFDPFLADFWDGLPVVAEHRDLLVGCFVRFNLESNYHNIF